jgi:hypothetical protein
MEEKKEEIVSRAEKMGWVDKEEWKGDPEKWRPAQEFVERGENIVPILKDRLVKVESDLSMALKMNAEELKAVRQQGYEQAKREYEKEIKALAEKEKEAVKLGDVDEWQRIQNEKSTIKPPDPVAQEKKPPTPEFIDWHSKNDWYLKDAELTHFAELVAESLAKKNVSPKEFYDTIGQRVKAAFPEKFTNANREKPSATESGNRSTGNSSKKSWSDLPSSAQATYNRLSKQFEAKGRKFTKEQYVKTYFEEQ